MGLHWLGATIFNVAELWENMPCEKDLDNYLEEWGVSDRNLTLKAK